jgi:hypothetical protein
MNDNIAIFIKLSGFYGPIFVDPTDVVGLIAEGNGNTSIRCKSQPPLIVKDQAETIAKLIADAMDGDILAPNA